MFWKRWGWYKKTWSPYESKTFPHVYEFLCNLVFKKKFFHETKLSFLSQDVDVFSITVGCFWNLDENKG